MKRIKQSEFKRKFSGVCRWLEAGETVEIFNGKRRFARIIPEDTRRSFLGSMEGTGTVPDDMEKPLGIVWNAMRPRRLAPQAEYNRADKCKT